MKDDRDSFIVTVQIYLIVVMVMAYRRHGKDQSLPGHESLDQEQQLVQAAWRVVDREQNPDLWSCGNRLLRQLDSR